MQGKPVPTLASVCLFALVLTLFLTSPAVASPAFSDVPDSQPYHTAINDLAGRTIIGGYPDGTFKPDNKVTRQQFAKMIVRSLGCEATEGDECSFTDVVKSLPGSYVDQNDPLYPDHYVAVCAAQGITVGKTATAFAPYDGITRQQLITMVARAANLPDAPGGYTAPFGPGQFYPEEHYLNARKAAYAGLLDGLQGVGLTYNFAGGASRGEVAQVLYNLLEKVLTTAPMQSAYRAALAEREAAGLPVPRTVTYESSVQTDPVTGIATVEAITTLEFDGPEQAGFTEWPAPVIIKSKLPEWARDKAQAGDYSQLVKDTLAAEFPGIWEQYTFGHEPRTYAVVETLVIPPKPRVLEKAAAALGDSAGLGEQTSFSSGERATSFEIPFGFTYEGPDVDWNIGCDVSTLGFTWFAAKAEFQFDYTFALRLPVEVALTLPDQVTEGESFFANSLLHGLDWGADDYAAAGLPSEGGNEYACRVNFFFGVKVVICEVDVFPWSHWKFDANVGESFVTPLTGDFTLGEPMRWDPDETGLCWDFGIGSVGVGLMTQPRLGSHGITAKWEPCGDALSSPAAVIDFPISASPSATIGPVTALDSNPDVNRAGIRLKDFRYLLSFMPRLGLYGGLKVFGYGGTTDDLSIDLDLADFSLCPYQGTPSTWDIYATLPGDAVFLDDGFEAENNTWTIFETDLHPYPINTNWGRTQYRAAAGSWSMYCAQKDVGAPGPYPDVTIAVMSAGPFDFSNSSTGYVDFDLWYDCAPAYPGWGDNAADYVGCWIISEDHPVAEISGPRWKGSSGGWIHESIDLTAVPNPAGPQDYTGCSVYVEFVFLSASQSGIAEGVYIDNVRVATTPLSATVAAWIWQRPLSPPWSNLGSS